MFWPYPNAPFWFPPPHPSKETSSKSTRFCKTFQSPPNSTCQLKKVLSENFQPALTTVLTAACSFCHVNELGALGTSPQPPLLWSVCDVTSICQRVYSSRSIKPTLWQGPLAFSCRVQELRLVMGSCPAADRPPSGAMLNGTFKDN